MKFKRLEIQAFKTFIDKLDGTFDFTINNEPADIVSIYAPNGFGKTSFHDAVDFCLTNNITRFIRDKSKASLNADQANILNREGQKQHILRAKNAPDDLDAFIEISTTNETFRRELPKARRGNKDYQFDDSKTDDNKKYFRDLMLSQESIDSFLRESKPEHRYKHFMESQLGGTDVFEIERQNIQLMLNEVVKRRDGLKKTLSEIEQQNAAFDVNDNSLSVINESISELRQFGYELTKILDTFSEDDKHELIFKILRYEQNVSDTQNDLFGKETELNTYLGSLMIFKNKFGEIRETNKKIISVNQDIYDLNRYLGLRAEQIILNERLTSNMQDIEDTVKWIKLVSKFVAARNHCLQLYGSITENKDKHRDLTQDLVSNDSKKKELEEQRIGLSENLNKHLRAKAEAPSIFSRIAEAAERLKKSELSKKEITVKLNAVKAKTESIHREIEEIEGIQVDVRPTQSKYDFIEDEIIPIVEQYKATTGLLSNSQTLLSQTEDRLRGVEEQNHAISELIQLGLKIIDKSQSNQCPLCLHEYASFESLSTQINSNPSLSDTHKEVLGRFQQQQAQKTIEEDKLRRLAEQLEIKINGKVFTLNQHVDTLEEEKRSLNTQISEIYFQSEKDNAELIELNSSVSHRTQEEFEVFIAVEITKATSQIENVELAIQETVTLCENINQQIQDSQVEIAALEGRHKQSIESGLYVDFNKYLVTISELPNIDEQSLEDTISDRLASSTEDLEKIRLLVENNFTDLKKLMENRPSGYFEDTHNTSEKLTAQLIALSEKHARLNQDISKFDGEVKRLALSGMAELDDWQPLKEAFEVALENVKKTIGKNKTVLSKFTLLRTLADNVLAYIENLKSTKKIKKLRADLDELVPIEKSLVDDLKKVNQSLVSQIDHYFHTNLINAIYAKIDPHPDFKRVSFKCDMSEDKPQLQVYIQSKDGNEVVSPTLHFSSAQINVLSLSIFLAKALNTTDTEGNPADCILIDDPVQSMDAINVLGVIDLLRNISINLGKQIILSTHDETFHALLKQKIPPNLFKSKFLELESFGKVGPHEGQILKQ